MTAEGKWFDDLDAVAADAAGALDRPSRARLYDRIDWFRLTIAHGLAKPPLVLRIAEGADRAWLFLTLDGTPLASWYTLAFAPIATRDDLLAPLFRAASRRFAHIALHPLVDDDRDRVMTALRAAGWWTFRHRASTNWTIDVERTGFAAYRAARPGPLRTTLDRRARSHPIEIAIHRAFDASAWADYEAVYAASWKPAEGSLPFLRALAEQEGAAGTLRLGIGRDAYGRAVAAQLWLVEAGVATIHKLAHREDAKAGSPGSLLSEAMFRSAIDEDHVRRIDFGLGDEPYKADWMDHAQPVWRIDAYRPTTLRGLAGIAREAAGRLARRVRPR
jgi:hypothetical protein